METEIGIQLEAVCSRGAQPWRQKTPEKGPQVLGRAAQAAAGGTAGLIKNSAPVQQLQLGPKWNRHSAKRRGSGAS